jgi:hypothetical protein
MNFLVAAWFKMLSITNSLSLSFYSGTPDPFDGFA